MSQQEFVPRQQQSENEDEIYAPQYPYSWSGNLNSEAVPRDEPPSSYEYDVPMQQVYQAQDGQASAASDQNAINRVPTPAQQDPVPTYQYNPYSNDGDAYEQGYRPHSSYSGYNAQQSNAGQGVPPWARPQEHARRPFRFGSILFILIMISLLQGLFTHGYWFVGRGGFEFILGGIFLPIFILMLLASWISRVMWGGRRGWRRRGPWGW
ncbi:MAG TPA: hypothetical protein VEL72_02520, partial [Ktedonobacteraceae bacterium]|nr:hypothetical protein [Ktedonobacteraceae bacterium]